MLFEDFIGTWRTYAEQQWEELCDRHHLPPAEWKLCISDDVIRMDGFFSEEGVEGRAAMQRWIDIAEGPGHVGAERDGLTEGRAFTAGIECRLWAITDAAAWEAHQLREGDLLARMHDHWQEEPHIDHGCPYEPRARDR
ncbi:MAG: hypothetical protein Q4G43_10865 [Mobilicoccus sp.]|nr:hypothetical protein [Mobilicoccus sp.]